MLLNIIFNGKVNILLTGFSHCFYLLIYSRSSAYLRKMSNIFYELFCRTFFQFFCRTYSAFAIYRPDLFFYFKSKLTCCLILLHSFPGRVFNIKLKNYMGWCLCENPRCFYSWTYESDKRDEKRQQNAFT